MDLAFLLEKIILISILTGVTLGMAAYLTYGERKIASFFQDRIGPDRAGPWGLLQPLADAGKMFFKEEIIPKNSEKWLFILGPALAMITWRSHYETSDYHLPWRRTSGTALVASPEPFDKLLAWGEGRLVIREVIHGDPLLADAADDIPRSLPTSSADR